MLLDPFLYEAVTEHQRTLRETADSARRPSALGPAWWRVLLRVSTTVQWHTVPSVARRQLGCRQRPTCWQAPGHALVGHDV
jgi:hypothetical protein